MSINEEAALVALQVAHVTNSLAESRASLEAMIENPATLRQIVAVAALMSQTLAKGGRIFSCGNGGSMCDAMHFAEELSGRYRLNRPALAAVSISDPSHMSCVANDYGYEFVFSRYIEAHGRPGDVVMGISTSGKSPNILAAARAAKAGDLKFVALTGAAGSPLAPFADIELAALGTSGYADRVQELHIKIIHILIELIERTLYPANYVG